MKRRSLLRWVFSAWATSPLVRGTAWARQPGAPAAPPELEASAEATLRALASTVLPASLGPDGIARVAGAFLAWIRDYREGAELDHGYGHTRIQSTGPSPAGRYPAQLEALEGAARDAGMSFLASSPERRRALVGAALAVAKIEELPERPDGRHVAADLMAFFFQSSEANNLCYGAAIDRDICRGLPGSEEPPVPLSKETR